MKWLISFVRKRIERDADISYINRGHSKTRRLIHFRYQWIDKVAMSLCDTIERDAICEPNALPERWWIEGKN